MSDDYTFFGVQIALRDFQKDDVRARLHVLIREGSEAQALHEKRAFWKRLTAIVNEAAPAFERGHWDLIRGSKAEGEFETWTSEIEGALASEPEEMGAATDEVHRLSSERYYVLVTFLFLVVEGSNSDLTLGERCDIPEKAWRTRETFQRLVGTPALLNFANVRADAVYLLPGNDSDGLSTFDLATADYAYLEPID
jgi:hypothetical protein